MALQGNLKFYEWQDDLTATPEIVSAVIPEDLPEDHPQYENRGKTVDVEVYPRIEVLTQEEEDVYIVIRMCALHLIDFIRDHENTPDKHFNVQYRYNIYVDKATRDADIYDTMIELEGHTVHVDNISEEDLNNKNLLAYCYDHLKAQRGCEDLVNA